MSESIDNIFSISQVFSWDDWLKDPDILVDNLCARLMEKIPTDEKFELASKHVLECIRPIGFEYRIIVYNEFPMLVLVKLNFDAETVKVIVKFVTRVKEDGIQS